MANLKRARSSSSLPRGTVAERLGEALDVTTASERLDELVEDEDHHVSVAARANPALSEPTLAGYLADGAPSAWCNPSVPFVLLARSVDTSIFRGACIAVATTFPLERYRNDTHAECVREACRPVIDGWWPQASFSDLLFFPGYVSAVAAEGRGVMRVTLVDMLVGCMRALEAKIAPILPTDTPPLLDALERWCQAPSEAIETELDALQSQAMARTNIQGYRTDAQDLAASWMGYLAKVAGVVVYFGFDDADATNEVSLSVMTAYRDIMQFVDRTAFASTWQTTASAALAAMAQKRAPAPPWPH